jgi:hypothetical protein
MDAESAKERLENHWRAKVEAAELHYSENRCIETKATDLASKRLRHSKALQRGGSDNRCARFAREERPCPSISRVHLSQVYA